MDDIKIYYCKKCHEKKRTISYDMAIEYLEKNPEQFEVEDKCISACGLAKKKFCAEVDEEIICADSMGNLLDKLGDL